MSAAGRQLNATTEMIADGFTEGNEGNQEAVS
jgi:hypothetical protein